MLKRALLLLGLALCALLIARTAEAQTGQPTDDDVNRVAKNLYCPVCENIPLDVCGTVACAQWRETIREKLAAGWTDQQIIDHFVTLYGERVLARPSTNGLTLLIWVLPPLAVLGGAAAWWVTLRRMRKSPGAQSAAMAQQPSSTATQTLDPYLARMEREFQRRQDASSTAP